jgi:iron complex transport system substrate-binding protein
MKYTIILGSISLVLLFMSCNSNVAKESTTDIRVYSEVNIEYAKGFKILKSDKDIKLVVKNPWQKATDITFEYVLSSDTTVAKNVIKTPIQKAICLSTTHLAYINALGLQESVCGITNPKLVNDTLIQSQLLSKLTLDIGNEQALNYESILSLQPDVVFAYGVGAEVQSVYHKFAEWGIPVVIVAEYLEDTPLAKTEWLKFFSYFYNKTELQIHCLMKYQFLI